METNGPANIKMTLHLIRMKLENGEDITKQLDSIEQNAIKTIKYMNKINDVLNYNNKRLKEAHIKSKEIPFWHDVKVVNNEKI